MKNDKHVFLFVIDSLANAGTENSILEIISHFSNNNNVLVIYLFEQTSLLPKFRERKINTIQLCKKPFFIHHLIRLIRILLRYKHVIVISSLYKSNILCRVACLLTHKKNIGTFVSDSYNQARVNKLTLLAKIKFYFFYLIDKISSKIPIHYISNSNSIKFSNCDKLQIPLAKVSIIHRGRDITKIEQWVKPNNVLFKFLIVARILETKGYKELIEAFCLVNRQHPAIQLQIIGDGNYHISLKKMVNALNLNEKVIFEGNILNAHAHLLHANCFVFPSWYEGLSGALIEAAMSGIPIIASDIPMNKEVIEDLPNVLFHQLRNAESIAAQMVYMINHYDDFASKAKFSREKTMEKFDINIIANHYESLLNNLIHENYSVRHFTNS